ncbi:MAG TPA: AAA family ATPase, partial [Chloroflexota bacterium]|nr:AAA family ATPase [Chloroflexota bacterium]
HQAFVLNARNDRALDYLSYQCTHHFNPTEYVDDVRLLLEGLTATAERDTPQPSFGEDAMPLGTGQDTRDKEPTVAREPKSERQAGRRTLLRKSRPSAATPVQRTHETPESTPAPVAGRAPEPPEPREQDASRAPLAEPTSEPMVRDASVVPPVMSSPPERRLAHGGQRAHRPSALPVPPTPLIGREQEVAAVRQRLLEPATRLLTLTGAGGTGKTRLAVQVAAEVLDVFPDGVYFVNLAPLSNPLLVLPTIAQTLGVREAGGQPLRDILYSFLHHKQLLLVLDNFEQVLEAAPEVADLLAVCADVRVLVTSRAALHLRGEHRYDVPPLALPELSPPPPLERLLQYEAVRLFVERARDVKPDFAVNNETAPAVAEICVRLDGLPLAIELAAARVRLFTPPALLARLSNRLGVLTGGARDLPARQRTLRATIDWSYSLLTAGEQVLFARLGVFVGGATLEAIAAVCNPDGELDVLQGVESLLEENLLRQMGEEEPRFVMLETIHEYARERLNEGGEADVLRRQHVAYYLAMAEQAEAGLHGPDQGDWLVRLEDEHDNVRAALVWCLGEGEHGIAGPGAAPAERTAAGVRLAGALWWFWYLHAHRREGLQWLERALSQGTAAPASRRDPAAAEGAEAAMRAGGRRAPANPRAARAKVALGAARIAWEQHQSEQEKKSASWCQSRLEESVALYREAGDRYGVADALSALGLLARRQAGKDRRFGVDPERGTALLEESLTLAREVGDPWLIACILERLATTADLQRDAERARARAQAEESLRLFQEVGDTLEIAIVQRVLGQIALFERDYARARAAFSVDLATTRVLGDKIGI